MSVATLMPLNKTQDDDDSARLRSALVASLRTGDVLLFNRQCSAMGLVGCAVCQFAKWMSEYDHVGVAFRDSASDEASPTAGGATGSIGATATISVLEANFNGVVCRPLEERLSRPHHNAVAVRQLWLDQAAEDTPRRRAVEKAVAELVRESNGAPYKRQHRQFLSGALQPPDKNESLLVARLHNLRSQAKRGLPKLVAALPAAELRDHEGRTFDSFLRKATRRQQGTLDAQVSLLAEVDEALQHRQRANRSGTVMGQNESGRRFGYFCSEQVITAWQRGDVVASFPPATSYGPHDIAPAAGASSTADDLRRRMPPALEEGWALGPELLLKAPRAAKPNSPTRRSVHRGEMLTAAGLRSAAAADSVFSMDVCCLVMPSIEPHAGPTWLLPAGTPLTLSDLGDRVVIPQSSGYLGIRPSPSESEGKAPQKEAPLPQNLRPRTSVAPLVPPVLRTAIGAEAARQCLCSPTGGVDAAVRWLGRGDIVPTDGLSLIVVRRGRVRRRVRSACDAEELFYPGDVVGLDDVLGALVVRDANQAVSPVSDACAVTEDAAATADCDGTEVQLVSYADVLRATGASGGSRGVNAEMVAVRAVLGLVLSNRVDPLVASSTRPRLDNRRFHELMGLIAADATRPQRSICRFLALAPLNLSPQQLVALHAMRRARGATNAIDDFAVDPAAATVEAEDMAAGGGRFTVASILQVLSLLTPLVRTRSLAGNDWRLGGEALEPVVRRLASLAPDDIGEGTVTLDEVNAVLQAAYRTPTGSIARSPFATIRPDCDGGDLRLQATRGTKKAVAKVDVSSLVYPFARYSVDDFLAMLRDGRIVVPAFVVDDIKALCTAVLYGGAHNGGSGAMRPASSTPGRFADDNERQMLKQRRDMLVALSDDIGVDAPMLQDLATCAKGAAAIAAADEDMRRRLRQRLLTLAASASVALWLLFPMEYVQHQRQLAGGKVCRVWRDIYFNPENLRHVYRCPSLRLSLLRMWLATLTHVSLLAALDATLPAVQNPASLVGSQANRLWQRQFQRSSESAADAQHERPGDGWIANDRYRLFAAVAFCGFIAAWLTYPYDVLRIAHLPRRSVLASSVVIGEGESTRALRRGIWKRQGLRGLWRGATGSLCLLVPYIGVHWVFYHESVMPFLVRRSYAPSAIMDEASTAATFPLSLPVVALWKMGLVGGAAVVHLGLVHPWDTVRMAAITQQQPLSAAFVNMCQVAEWKPHVIVRRLYSGAGIALCRLVPSLAVSYGAFWAVATHR